MSAVNELSKSHAARAAVLVSSLQVSAAQLDETVRRETAILGATTRKDLFEAAAKMRGAANAIAASVGVQLDAGAARAKGGAT